MALKELRADLAAARAEIETLNEVGRAIVAAGDALKAENEVQAREIARLREVIKSAKSEAAFLLADLDAALSPAREEETP